MIALTEAEIRRIVYRVRSGAVQIPIRADAPNGWSEWRRGEVWNIAEGYLRERHARALLAGRRDVAHAIRVAAFIVGDIMTTEGTP